MHLNDYGKREWLREVISDFYCFAVVMTICIGFILCCTGCSSTRPVTIERTVHDTTYVERTRADSFLQRDSVYLEVFARGDTVYRTKYVDRWRDRMSVRHDTIYATRADSISVPPVQEKKKCKWKLALVTAGKLVILTLFMDLAVVIVGFIWLRRRKV